MLVLSSGSIQLARKSANNVQRSKRVSVEASHRNTSRGEEVQKRNSACVSTIMSGKFLSESNSRTNHAYYGRAEFLKWNSAWAQLGPVRTLDFYLDSPHDLNPKRSI